LSSIKDREFLDQLSEFSFSRSTLLHGVSWNLSTCNAISKKQDTGLGKQIRKKPKNK
jgi:hypothetical protein